MRLPPFILRYAGQRLFRAHVMRALAHLGGIVVFNNTCSRLGVVKYKVEKVKVKDCRLV